MSIKDTPKSIGGESITSVGHAESSRAVNSFESERESLTEYKRHIVCTNSERVRQ